MEGDASDLNRDLFEGGAAHTQHINVRLVRLYFNLGDVIAKGHIDFGVEVE